MLYFCRNNFQKTRHPKTLHGRRGIQSRATESFWQGPLTKTILDVNCLINGSLSVSEFQVHCSTVCFLCKLFHEITDFLCHFQPCFVTDFFFFLAHFISVVD